MRDCLRVEKEFIMKSLILVIVAISVVSTLSGCATVCNPQAPGVAIQSGTAIGLVGGVTQFAACSGYYVAKAAIGDKKDDPENLKVSAELDAAYASAVIEGEKYAAEGKAYAAAEAAEAAKKAQPVPVAVVAVPAVAIVAIDVKPVTAPVTK